MRRLWSQTDFGETQIDLAFFVRGNIASNQGFRSELGFIKPLMRRGFLAGADLAYDEDMRLGEDYDLYARALAAGARFGLVDPAGYVAVTRSASLSVTGRTADLEALWRADKRLLARSDLPREARRAIAEHELDLRKEVSWRRLIDAVRTRDAVAAARAFSAGPAVALSLSGKLAEQAVLRLSGRGGRRAGASS